MKCKRSNDGRAIDKAGMHALRVQAIKAVRKGRTVADVAEAFGFNERTVFNRLARYAEGGQKALQAKPESPVPEQHWLLNVIYETAQHAGGGVTIQEGHPHK